MILDAAEKLGAAQAVTDTDAYTTHTKDCGIANPDREIGAGEPMCLAFVVDVAAVGSTDTTDLIAVNSANANLSSHIELASRRIPNARLTLGSIHYVPIPPGSVKERYLGGRIELGSADTITVSTFLIPQQFAQQQEFYPSGIEID